ncbi:Double-strand break repair protein MRE11 [Porphyridium purpureum]|uniref:Double-strand break repair protein MRE11 n=1 Tax=Porphyridium purpureum TaxID=35688 RepID=A0A5J4YXN6_PORPP|nr:Double-strand break repair protein MRE11 [Porphyridium purpureum]|eukprot:POR0035..scf208_2
MGRAGGGRGSIGKRRAGGTSAADLRLVGSDSDASEDAVRAVTKRRRVRAEPHSADEHARSVVCDEGEDSQDSAGLALEESRHVGAARGRRADSSPRDGQVDARPASRAVSLGEPPDCTANEDDPDELRVFLITDTHLGYAESDTIRAPDSFRAFEEALALAREYKADMLVHGGDLFHLNRPSKASMLDAYQILHSYSWKGEPPKFPLTVAGSASEGRPFNFLSPHLKVSMPVFAIHGNHDDPSAASANRPYISSLDELAENGVINYFGVFGKGETVQVEPLLITKGITRLALYGLGNMRDEQLHEKMGKGEINWMSPEEEAHRKTWFNLLALHQDRAVRGSKKAVSPHMLPEWMDMVLWGHEHECRVELEGGHPAVTQPGSSVATSLCEAEAVPKHVAMLTIRGMAFKFDKIPLLTTRPFYFQTVNLTDEEALEPHDAAGIEAFAEKRIEAILAQSSRDWSVRKSIVGKHFPHVPFYRRFLDLDDVSVPLIRLRLDHNGDYATFSSVRFGQKFVNRVANSMDLVLFSKPRAPVVRRPTVRDATGEAHEDAGLTVKQMVDKLKRKRFDAEDAEDINMMDLVGYCLDKQRFVTLSKEEVLDAMFRFVYKQETGAFGALVEAAGRTATDAMAKGDVPLDEAEQVERMCKDAAAARVAALREREGGLHGLRSGGTDRHVEIERVICSLPHVNAQPTSGDPSAAASARKGGSRFMDSDESADDDADSDVTAPARGRGRGRGRGSLAGRGARGRGALASASAARSTARTSANKKTSRANYDRDEDSDVQVVAESGSEEARAPVSQKRSASTRARASVLANRDDADTGDDARVEVDAIQESSSDGSSDVAARRAAASGARGRGRGWSWNAAGSVSRGRSGRGRGNGIDRA